MNIALEKGFVLEEPPAVIPWLKSREELERIGHAVVVPTNDRDRVFWNGCRFLGGLTGQLYAEFMHNNDGDDERSDGLLRDLYFSVDRLDGESVKDQHDRVMHALDQLFGFPASVSFVYGRPCADWSFGQVLVCYMVFERFGDYCVGEVWFDPPAWRVH